MSRQAEYDDYGDEEDYSDYGDYAYDEADHDVENYVGGDLGDIQEEEEVDYNPDEEEHIGSEGVYGIKRCKLVFNVAGSLEKFARLKASTISKPIVERDMNHLKHVTSMTGRNNPTKENTIGNLDRIILLGARITRVANQAPLAVKFKFNPKVIVPETHSNGLCTERIEAFTAPQKEDFNIFSPTNIFAKRMLQKWERCDEEALLDEFQFFNKSTGTALVRIMDVNGKPSVALDLLASHPNAFPGITASEIIRNRVPDMPQYSSIPEDVAKKLHDYMKGELEKIRASFISVDDITASFHRADGREWNAHSHLVGEAAALEHNKQGEYKKIVLNSENEIAVHVELQYISVA